MTPPTPSPQPTPPAEDQPMRLAKSMLTGHVYATRYDADVPDGEHPRVIEKHDVTADYRALADAEHAARQLLDDPIGQAAGREPGQQLDEAEEARLRDVIRSATATSVHSDTLDQADAPESPARDPRDTGLVEPNAQFGEAGPYAVHHDFVRSDDVRICGAPSRNHDWASACTYRDRLLDRGDVVDVHIGLDTCG